MKTSPPSAAAPSLSEIKRDMDARLSTLGKPIRSAFVKIWDNPLRQEASLLAIPEKLKAVMEDEWSDHLQPKGSEGVAPEEIRKAIDQALGRFLKKLLKEPLQTWEIDEDLTLPEGTSLAHNLAHGGGDRGLEFLARLGVIQKGPHLDERGSSVLEAWMRSQPRYILHEEKDSDGRTFMSLEKVPRVYTEEEVQHHKDMLVKLDDPRNRSDGVPLLRTAVECDLNHLIAPLHARGASLYEREEATGHTPIHSAISVRNLEAAAELLKLGADLNQPSLICQIDDRSPECNLLTPVAGAMNGWGEAWSPFESPADHDDFFARVLPWCLERGARLDTRDCRGNTVLHQSWLAHEDGSCVARLLAGGAPVNAVNAEGKTPLKVFTERLAEAYRDGEVKGKPPECIQNLLAAGADPTRADRLGRTPLDDMREVGWSQMVAVLEKGVTPAMSPRRSRP